LDSICGVENPAHIAGEGVERDNLAPGAPPALPDGRIFLAPEALLEGAERGFAGGGVDGPVNALERGRHGLAVFPGREIEAVAQQVNNRLPVLAPAAPKMSSDWMPWCSRMDSTSRSLRPQRCAAQWRKPWRIGFARRSRPPPPPSTARHTRSSRA